jgi:hypothetical protein
VAVSCALMHRAKGGGPESSGKADGDWVDEGCDGRIYASVCPFSVVVVMEHADMHGAKLDDPRRSVLWQYIHASSCCEDSVTSRDANGSAGSFVMQPIDVTLWYDQRPDGGERRVAVR